MKIVGFGAHPDDVEIFFLGALLAAKSRGHDIGWVIASDGEAGIGPEFSTIPVDEWAALRRKEASASAAMFGVRPTFLGLPDGALRPGDEAAALVRDRIDALSPDLIITHAPNDDHPDHRSLGELVQSLAGPVPVVFCDTMRSVGFTPDFCVNVTADFQQKLAAIHCHASQQPAQFAAIAQTMNSIRALQCELPPNSYAEAFRFAGRPVDGAIARLFGANAIARSPAWMI